MTDQIEFFAQYGNWVAVKKLKIEDHKPMDVARFLASVNETMNRKMWEFIGDEIPLDAMDEIAYELTGAQKKGKKMVVSRKSEDEINTILAKMKGPSTTKKIKQHVTQKGLIELSKIYITRRVFELLGVKLEPNSKQIEKYLNKKDSDEC
ncbi:DUF2666 domain-containing protein [archaeon]|nr:DUF2666 domain-containing protein [archaeon]